MNQSNKFHFLGNKGLYAFVNNQGKFYHLGVLQSYRNETDDLIDEMTEKFDPDHLFEEHEVIEFINDAYSEMEIEDLEGPKADSLNSITKENLLEYYLAFNGLNSLNGINANLDTIIQQFKNDVAIFASKNTLVYTGQSVGMASTGDFTVTLTPIDDNQIRLLFIIDYGTSESTLYYDVPVEPKINYKDIATEDEFFNYFGFAVMAIGSFDSNEFSKHSVDEIREALTLSSTYGHYLEEDFNFNDLKKNVDQWISSSKKISNRNSLVMNKDTKHYNTELLYFWHYFQITIE